MMTAVSLFLLLPTIAFAEPLKIKAKAFTTFKAGVEQRNFGKLEFLGGLILKSKHDDFGGLSAFRFMNGSTFIAITDKARVITGTLERKDARPFKIKGEKITRIKDSNGKTITGAKDKDSESIAMIENQFLIGYERNDRLMRFNLRGRTLIADAAYKIDFEPFDFPENKGLEAIAFDKASRKLFAFAEYALNSEGNHKGFIVSNGKIEKEISVRERNGFSLTDAAFLPDGDLLMLERYYNPLIGPFMQLRRIARETLETDQIWDGDVIAYFDNTYEIDNIEGLAISEMDNGATRLTLVSDDNFSRNQRTLLLEFKLND
ncbi:MAG: esterase-like activity of phytase family protein [Pseudomonadota bacterium]